MRDCFEKIFVCNREIFFKTLNQDNIRGKKNEASYCESRIAHDNGIVW